MADDQSSVQYREIKGCPGYRIGDDGTIWSSRRRWAEGEWRQREGVVWKAGYRRIILWTQDGGKRQAYVHVLVLEAFIGLCPEGMECRHLNGIPDDNRLTNLKWGTPQENTNDKIEHGTVLRGEASGMAKTCDADVKRMRKLYRTGRYTTRQLGKMFNIGKSTAGEIVSGRAWSHVT